MQIDNPPGEGHHGKHEGEQRGLVIAHAGHGDSKSEGTAGLGLAPGAHG